MSDNGPKWHTHQVTFIMLRLLQTRESFFNCGHYVLTYNQVGGHYVTMFTLFCMVIIRFLQNVNVADIMLRLSKNEKKVVDIILRLTIETSIRVSGYYAILFFHFSVVIIKSLII